MAALRSHLLAVLLPQFSLYADRTPCTSSSHSNSPLELHVSSFKWNTNGPNDRPIPSVSGGGRGETQVFPFKLRNCDLMQH